MRGLMMAASLLSLAACSQPPSADQAASQQQEQVAARAQAEVGIYQPTHFTRKRLANRIGQMLDDPSLATISYAQDFNGKLRCIGHTIGFPLPGATQTTSPEKWDNEPIGGGNVSSTSFVLVPQAEPDQLFSPSNEDATWLLMVTKTGGTEPVYFEGKVQTFLEDAKPDPSLIEQDCL